MMKYVALVFLILTAGCVGQFGNLEPLSVKNSKEEKVYTLNDQINRGNVKTYTKKMNLSYGEHPRHKYDLYRPVYVDSNSTAPSLVIVTIHGGGWCLLDKAFINPVVNSLLAEKKNIVVFNINHRLAGVEDISYREMMEDFDLVMKEVEAKKEEYNLTGDVVLHGYSSGGHLAISYAQEAKDNSRLKLVSAIAAPIDLTEEAIHNGIYDDKGRNLTEIFMRGSIKEKPEHYKTASPYLNLKNRNTSTILFYGEKDVIVNVSQGKKMAKLLSDSKIDNKLVVYKEGTHEMQSQLKEITRDLFRYIAQR